MGARRLAARAMVLAAVALAGARARAETVTEPIARFSVEGGWDSNALYDGGGGDRKGRISPELGLRLRDHRLDLTLAYGLDYVVYQRRAPGGIWNHRAMLELEAEPGRRLRLEGALRAGLAFDPVGLAQMGVFRAGRGEAFLASGSARAQWRATRRIDVAATLAERAVRFDDGTGGAMHQPGVEVLWRVRRRLSAGAGYALGVFQDFGGADGGLAFSHGLHARVAYRASRRVALNAFAGPALYGSPGSSGLVPEAGVEALWSSRGHDLRAAARHALGIGSTARPGLVDSVEVGALKRLDRRWTLRGDVGLWHSGEAPSGANAVTGYAIAGEVSMLVGAGVRVGVGGSHFSRIDDPSPAFRRTTAGVRVGWEAARRP
jgi:hypothetical protein